MTWKVGDGWEGGGGGGDRGWGWSWVVAKGWEPNGRWASKQKWSLSTVSGT